MEYLDPLAMIVSLRQACVVMIRVWSDQPSWLRTHTLRMMEASQCLLLFRRLEFGRAERPEIEADFVGCLLDLCVIIGGRRETISA
jgi:hypothetical protein